VLFHSSFLTCSCGDLKTKSSLRLMRRLRHAARSDQRLGHAQVRLGRHRELARGSNGVREIGKLRRVTLISRSQYPGLGLRRLLLQRLFPGLRRRAGLWNQPSYSRNQGFESSRQERGFLKKASRKSTPRKRLPSKAKPSRSTKLDVLGRKETVGTDIISGVCRWCSRKLST